MDDDRKLRALGLQGLNSHLPGERKAPPWLLVLPGSPTASQGSRKDTGSDHPLLQPAASVSLLGKLGHSLVMAFSHACSSACSKALKRALTPNPMDALGLRSL